MDANYNSLTARLYRWFYMKESMPTNLCPYFWKCVLMYILIVPYTMLSLPIIILRKTSFVEDLVDTPFDRAFFGLVLFFLAFMIGCMAFLTITIWDANKETYEKFKELYATGVFGWVITITIFVTFLIIEIKDRLEFKRYSSKPDGMIKSFIKAKYNKYCPKINWKK